MDDARKNVRLLLTAYYYRRLARPDAPSLLLAGQSDLSAADREYVNSLGLTNYVETRVNVSREQLRLLYQGATAFVLSSNEEGLGVVILEAMACGLPVVSTDCGGPSTAVIDGVTGELTRVGDAQALAAALQRRLEQPEVGQQMGQAGRRRVEQHFSLEAVGRIYLQTYDEILDALSD